MLDAGAAAPDFKLASTGGTEVRLSEATQRYSAVVLAFYALDFTPG